MPSPPRDLPHLFLEGGGAKEPYTSHGGGGSRPQVPSRDRADHAARLADDIGAAVAEGRGALSTRPAGTPSVAGGRAQGPGIYLEFALEAGPSVNEALQRLEDQRRGIELLAVREPPPEAEGEILATVFVPERSVGHFEERVRQYRDDTTHRGRPKHELLVATVNHVRTATAKSVFTDPEGDYPTDDRQELWWELWIRRGFEGQVDISAQRLGIVVKPHVVRFAERDVKLVRASAAKLTLLMRYTDGVAELRIARDTPAFFMHQSNVTQGEWVSELLSRLVPSPIQAQGHVAICLLDGGIAREHPLLAPHIQAADVHAVDPNWSGAEDILSPHAGHGTGMGGLALYGDLTDVLAGSDRIEVPYILEAVKILPPVGANEPEAYGAITLQGIARAEVAAPMRNRIVCSAVTSRDSGQGGRPSSWSAAVDNAAYGAFGTRRLIIVSAGNVRDPAASWGRDYLERNDTAQIECPAQAWNAISVGAFTEKVNITDGRFAAWRAVAPPGDLCPSSRTGLIWQNQWPVKPDVVLEGGNYAHDGGPTIEPIDDLQLLTAGHRLATRLLTTFGDTSAASALAANMAAHVAATRPNMWPETVRALVVHSAEWTPTMLSRVAADPPASRKRSLLRRYGYGVPDLSRAVRSARNDLTLVVEDTIRPFRLDGSEVKTREMSLHRLPWPTDALRALANTLVELRVTLSYFIEPNPGERGWIRRHRYASHSLRFEVKRALESDDEFRRRINRAALAEEDGYQAAGAGADDWYLGPRARNVGSIHSDVWQGTAEDLARRGAIGIYPVGGWWREQRRLERYDCEARYSLVATIRVPNSDIDIYTPVSLALSVMTPSDIEIEVESQ